MKKNILILALFSPFTFAANIGSGQFEYDMKVTANVAALCSYVTGNTHSFNFGNYVKEAISRTLNSTFGCRTGTTLKFSLELGTNPKSTPEFRRLPLNGEQGDVKNYMQYKVSINNKLLGINEDSIFISNFDSNSISIVAFLYAEQPNIIPGSYSDNLTLNVEYY